MQNGATVVLKIIINFAAFVVILRIALDTNDYNASSESIAIGSNSVRSLIQQSAKQKHDISSVTIVLSFYPTSR